MGMHTSEIKIITSSLRVVALYLKADIDFNLDTKIINISNKYSEQDIENLCTLKNVKFKDISSEGIVSYDAEFTYAKYAENVQVLVKI